MNILHLSDLHFFSNDDADTWYSQLADDLSSKDLACDHLDLVLLSGDIANVSTPEEYAVAETFVRKLKTGFNVEDHRWVIVPGNHDLSFDISKEALNADTLHRLPRYQDEYDETFDRLDPENDSVFWVCNREKYQKRFDYFRTFYQNVTGTEYPAAYENQGIIYAIPEFRVLFLGLNSCWKLDHLRTCRSDIHMRALSHALDEIRQCHETVGDYVKFAVFHHPLAGAPADCPLADVGFLERLAAKGFCAAFHGHVHKLENSLFRYDRSPHGRRVEIIGAGTFGVRPDRWTQGYPNLYNYIQIKDKTMRVHTRCRYNEHGAWEPYARWRPDESTPPLPYYDVELPQSVSESPLPAGNDSDGGGEPIEPAADIEIEFVNRDEDLREIKSNTAAPYLLIDAPRGYGKTRLLIKFVEDSTQYLLLTIWKSENPSYTFGEIVETLSLHLDVCYEAERFDTQGPEDIASRIAQLIVEKMRIQNIKESMLIIDDAEKIVNSSGKSDLIRFLRSLVAGIKQKYAKSIRLILSGSYILHLKHENIILPLKEKPLNPFEYEAVYLTVQKFDEHIGANFHGVHQRRFALFLMYITGGHPGAMVQFLNRYYKNLYNFSDDDIGYTEIVCGVIGEVFSHIPEELKDIFTRLSVIRRFNAKVLRYLIDNGFIVWKEAENVLLDRLTATFLVEEDETFYRDAITRRLLAIHFRKTDRDAYIGMIRAAIRCYEVLLTDPKRFRKDLIILEILFQELHLSFYEAPQEKTVEETLFHRLNDIVSMMKIDRKDEVMINFYDDVRRDWEFSYLFNYRHLDHVTDHVLPFNGFLEKLHRFIRE